MTEVLAELRPRLLGDAQALPGERILQVHFTTVQKAIGTARANLARAEFLRSFVEEAKASGLVARLIAQYAPPALSVTLG